MADELTLKHVTKFDGQNFQIWKFQMNTIFVACDLLEVVNGSEARPMNNEAHTVAYKSWLKRNAKAMFLISSSMDPKQMDSLLLILTCTTAHEMWNKLTTIHEQKSATNKLILTQKFHEYRMNPSDSVVQHVAKVQNMAQQLKDVEEQVSDVAIRAKILASLPAKFNALKTAWDSVAVDDQKIDSLIERLIKEEMRITADDSLPSAFTVAMNIKSDSVNKGKHLTNKSSGITCYRCHRKGHFARSCSQKNKKNNEYKPTAFVASLSEVSENSHKAGKVEQGQSVALLSHQPRGIMTRDSCDVWLADSGASRHISYRREWFIDYRSIYGEVVALGDNDECNVVGCGSIAIDNLIDGRWRRDIIENVLHVPKTKKNLFSIGVCTSKGFNVEFNNDRVKICREGKIFAEGFKQDNEIFRMAFRVNTPPNKQEANITSTLEVWHERFGHVNKQTVKEMSEKQMVEGVSLSNVKNFFCEPCQVGKSHKQFFKKHTSKEPRKPGECISSDVCGPMSIESVGGNRYYVIFKDDVSGFRLVYFIKHKSDVFERFKEFEKMIVTKFGKTMRILHTDNGTEYCNIEMRAYLSPKGITMENTAPYTPEQNGRCERDNRTIVESARTMLLAKNLPIFLWAEAVYTAVYILNRTVNRSCPGKTPYEIWVGKKPEVDHFKIFGSDAFVHVPKQLRTKLEAKAKKKIFVGYQGDSKNYRLYDPITKRISVSRDVIFNEKLVRKIELLKEDEPICLKFRNQEVPHPVVQNDPVERRNQEKPQPVVQDDPGVERNAGQLIIDQEEEHQFEDAQDVLLNDGSHQEDNEEEHNVGRMQLRDRRSLQRPKRYEVNFTEYTVPKNYEEAVNGPDSAYWSQAIKEELNAHQENQTWKLITRDKKKKTIDSKWVFKVLKNTNGEVKKFKARLCARGFLQQEGIDYQETFAPVVRYDSLRVFLSLVTEKDLELIQFDVCTAFLNGELQEDIHMEVPQGLSTSEDKEKVVCQLQKSLHGLKQSPRCWNIKFTEALRKINFKQNSADKCIFYGRVNDEEVFLNI